MRKLKLQARVARNGEHYFVILGGNGEVMMTSETYATPYNCVRAQRKMMEYMRPGVAEIRHIAE